MLTPSVEKNEMEVAEEHVTQAPAAFAGDAEEQTIYERFKEHRGEPSEGKTYGERFMSIGPRLFKLRNNKVALEREKLARVPGEPVELNEDTTTAFIHAEIARARKDIVRIVYEGGGNLAPQTLPQVVNIQNIVKSQEALLDSWQVYRNSALKILQQDATAQRRKLIHDIEATIGNLEVETSYSWEKVNKPEFPYFHHSVIAPDDSDLFLKKVLGKKLKVGSEQWKTAMVRLTEIIDQGVTAERREDRRQRLFPQGEPEEINPNEEA